MNHYPRYPAYKSSGINWLGKIPAHWDVMRLKFACQINPPKSEISSLPEKTPVSFLPMEKIGEDGSLDLSENRAIGEVKQGFTYFRDNDVIVAKITPCFENGKGALVRNLKNGLGFGTTELHVLRCYIGSYPGFIFYLARNHFFKVMGTSEMSGVAGQQRVPTSFVENFRAGFPPFEEQQAIVAFLDEQTAVLDNLISEKQALIGLLQEKRAAVISRAVTQGLDSAVALKDSGVDWIGRVSETCEIVKLKRIATIIDGDRGKEYPNENDLMPEGIPFLSSKNIINNTLSYENLRFISPEKFARLGRGKLETDDLVITVRGTIGSVGHFKGVSYETSFINAQMMIIRPHAEINSHFLHFVAVSNYWKAQLEINSYGTAQQQLSNEILANAIVILPPLIEQNRIVDRLNHATEELDKLITETDASIATLQEYRTALIASAVTGQIDVRQALIHP